MDKRMSKHLINTIKDIENICKRNDYTEKEKLEGVLLSLQLLHSVDIDKIIK